MNVKTWLQRVNVAGNAFTNGLTPRRTVDRPSLLSEASAKMGSCSGTKHGFRGFGVFLSHPDRHRHVSFPSAYHPHVGKNLQLLQISPFRQLQKRDPRLSQASVLLMGQQKYHLFSPSKDSSRRPNSKSVKLSEIFPHYIFG